MIEILPAIMPKSYSDLEFKISLVARYVKWVQLDIMDGKFVKSRSWPYYSSDRESLEALRTEDAGMPHWEDVNFEADLMVSKPEDVVDDWIALGAARLVVHAESTDALGSIVQAMNARFAGGGPRDVELCVAINVDTSTDVVLPYLEDIQGVQFMGIDVIGRQGETFNETVIEKIRTFHAAHPEVLISVDGGVNFENAHALVEAGAKRLISGSAIFEFGNPADAISRMKASV